MANGTIGLPEDGVGKKVDTEELTVGGETVQRQRGQISGASAMAIAVVTNQTPAGSDMGLVVREAARGQADQAGSMPVVIASDQSAVPVSASSLPLPSGGGADRIGAAH